MNIEYKPFQKRTVFVTVLVTAVILMFLFSTFALLEYSRSKNDLISMLNEEGAILLETLRASSERNVLAFEALEDLMQRRLLSGARMIEEQDYVHGLDRPDLNRLASTMDLFRIHLLDATGRRTISSAAVHPGGGTPDSALNRAGIVDFIQNGRRDTLIVGLREGQYQNASRYAVVLRRRRGGGVVVTADAARLLDFRKELGPGRLIQEIGQRQGIAYVVLQDTLGILLASRNVIEMSQITGDPFLNDINRENFDESRFIRYNDTQIFEIAGCFLIDGVNLGVFRIGLEAAHYQHILNNVRNRLIFIVLLFVLMGIAGIGFWVAKQNARALSISYRQVKTHTGEILQSMNEAVIVIDHSGKVTVFNQAAGRLFGITQNTVLGQPLQSIPVVALEILRKTMTSEKSLDRPWEEVLIGDERKILSLRTSILEKENGGTDSVILVAADLTVQAELEAALRRKEKMSAMGKLASGVAHEIRNPINAIGMIAQRFLKEFKPVKDVEEYESLAKTIVQEIRRSDIIIQRFLRFARPAELNLAPVSMDQLLQDTASVMRSKAVALGIDFTIKVEDDTTLILDRDQMKQALINLIQNGLEAVSNDDRIILCGRMTDSVYEIEVSDTGSGISEAELNNIFDLYFTTKPDGLGLGLAMVQQIIQRHGGRIDVTSIVGKGTTFIIQLPGETR